MSTGPNANISEEICRRRVVLSLWGGFGMNVFCPSFLDPVTSSIRVCPLAVATGGGFIYVEVFRSQSSSKIVCIVSLPPIFLNTRRDPSKAPGPSSGLSTSSAAKLPLTSVYRVTRAIQLSMPTHGAEERKQSPYHPSSGVKVTDVNAGAEWMEDSIYARRGKGLSKRRPACTVVRAGSGGRGTAGSNSFA